MEQAYQHLPLPSKKHIRLITVDPSEFDDDVISIQIISIPFKDAVKAGYIALSYVWGDDSDARYVHIRNYDEDEDTYLQAKLYLCGRRHRRQGEFQVTKNLHEALYHLRQDHSSKYLWVDALCINQTDDIEKSLQVRRMGSIYKRATSVLAWLGPASEHSEEAIAWMTLFGNEIDVDWAILALVPRINATNAEFGDATKKVILSTDLAAGVLYVVGRPWFLRAWIRQEVYVPDPSKVRLLCGHSGITWTSFRHVLIGILWKTAEVIARGPDEDVVAKELAQQIAARLSQLHSFMFQDRMINLCGLRYSMDGVQCKDDRDRIFAFLDMLHPVHKPLKLVPDYSKTVAEVYHTVCLRYLTKFKDANILQDCYLLDGGNDMPSWVPDWRQTLASRHWLYSRAFGGIGPRRRITDGANAAQGSILHICGVRGPIIDEMAPVGRQPPSISATKDWTEWVAALRDVLLPPACLDDMDVLYPAAEPLTNIEVYASVLSGWDYRLEQRPRHVSTPALSASVAVLRILLESQHVKDRQLLELTEEIIQIPGSLTFLVSALHCLNQRRIARSSTGSLMLVPGTARVGDEACALVGCDPCMLLRPSCQPGELGQYRLVAPCFVPGLSNAEAILGPLPTDICQLWDYQNSSWGWTSAATDYKVSFFDPRTESLLEKLPHKYLNDYRRRLLTNPFCTLVADIKTIRDHSRSVSPVWNDVRYFEII